MRVSSASFSSRPLTRRSRRVSCQGGLDSGAGALRASARAGARIRGRANSPGARFAERQVDLVQAEAVIDLIRRSGAAPGCEAALRQLEGGLSTGSASLRTELANLSGALSYDIDFPAEDSPVGAGKTCAPASSGFEAGFGPDRDRSLGGGSAKARSCASRPDRRRQVLVFTRLLGRHRAWSRNGNEPRHDRGTVDWTAGRFDGRTRRPPESPRPDRAAHGIRSGADYLEASESCCCASRRVEIYGEEQDWRDRDLPCRAPPRRISTAQPGAVPYRSDRRRASTRLRTTLVERLFGDRGSMPISSRC